MHKAICSECGEKCEVPFKPTGDKPVFCSKCFEIKTSANRSSERNAGQSKFREKRMYRAICAECGTECEVPFQPTPGKPIYCKNCFRKADSTGSKKTEQFKEQFKILNAKLDTIIKLLNPTVSTEEKRVPQATSKPEVSQLPKVTIIKQTKRTVSPQKTVKKKVAAKETVTKKATKKSIATKKKAKKTVSPKKTVKRKVVAKKTVAKKGTRKKKTKT